MDNNNENANNINVKNTEDEPNYTYMSIDDFRRNATEDDYKKLEEYIIKQSNRQGAFPGGEYNFSYSAASKELREKGYLPITKKSKKMKENITMTTGNTEHKTITITGGKNRNYITRSYPIDKEILDRFDRMSEYYEDFSKKALLSEILDQGLKHYGF